MQNDLMGPISKQIGFLVEMKELILQRNSLTSLVPSEVGLLEQQFFSGKLSDRNPASVLLGTTWLEWRKCSFGGSWWQQRARGVLKQHCNPE